MRLPEERDEQEHEQKTLGAQSATEGDSACPVVPASTASHVAPELKEGDVYRFSYSQAECDKANRGWAGSLRHCFEGFVIVRNGKLCDTFWGLENSEARVVRPDQGEMVYMCNINDVRKIRRYEAIHYDAADVFRISEQHGCTEHFFVRKDAAISSTRILDEIRKKRHDVEDQMKRAVSNAASTLFQLGELQRAVESGDLSRKPWW